MTTKEATRDIARTNDVRVGNGVKADRDTVLAFAIILAPWKGSLVVS